MRAIQDRAAKVTHAVRRIIRKTGYDIGRINPEGNDRVEPPDRYGHATRASELHR